MRILKVEIRHFRSLLKLDFDATHATVICGTNSCGKSNVLRALKFAFLPSYSPERMAANLCHQVASPNAYATVRIRFDSPTTALAASMQLPQGQPFVYQVRVKRNGTPSYQINGAAITPEERARFLEEVVVVHVPPIRDLAAGGLNPFKATLAAAIRKSRGTDSLGQLNDRVRAAVKKSGKAILSGTQASAKMLLDVEELSVDVSRIEIDGLLPMAGMTFKAGGVESSLDKLGTGHQSSVILSLYRQLGVATAGFRISILALRSDHGLGDLHGERRGSLDVDKRAHMRIRLPAADHASRCSETQQLHSGLHGVVKALVDHEAESNSRAVRACARRTPQAPGLRPRSVLGAT